MVVLEKEIEELEQQKVQAISEEAYERAGEIKALRIAKAEELERLNEKWQNDKENRNLVVGEDEIASVVSDWTKIPVRKLALGESEQLMSLESTLHERVVGQEEAVTAVAKAIRRGRVGLKEAQRIQNDRLASGLCGL